MGGKPGGIGNASSAAARTASDSTSHADPIIVYDAMRQQMNAPRCAAQIHRADANEEQYMQTYMSAARRRPAPAI
eukprot:3412314-Pleurochrysis_carterae.AAC.3